MGSCYSHKAGGGKYTYTTVQMASTKLEDSSRLARPTPYSRGSLTSARKGIPVAKVDQSVCNNQSNNRNVSPLPLQSSIPRFNSSASMSKQEVNQNLIYSARVSSENSSLNVINNNAIPASHSTNNVETLTTIASSSDGNKSKINANSRSCPDSISKQLNKSTDKLAGNKTIPKFSLHGASSNQRPFRSRFISNSDALVSPSERKNASSGYDPLTPKCDKTLDSSSSDLQAELCSSKSSFVLSDSHDSITDSGLGNSLAEKNKQEDGDTLKDVERLDIAIPSLHGKSFSSDKKQSPVETFAKGGNKPALKCPTYKRSLNGKWVREDNKPAKGVGMVKSPCQNILETSHEKSSQQIFNNERLLTKKPLSNPRSMNPTLQKEKLQESVIVNAITTSSKTSHVSKRSISDVDCKNLTKSSSGGDYSSISESDDKSDGLGSDTKSPVSDAENRDFLIDDEISDQPNLISVSQGKNIEDASALSLQQSVTELYALSSAVKGEDRKTRDRLGSDHRDSFFLGSELGSSCSSIASDDMMLDYEKRSEFPDGTINEGLASPVRKLSDLEITDDQLSELGLDKLRSHDVEDKNRKRLHRRLSNPSGGGSSLSGKDEWRSRSVSCPLRPPRSMSVSEAEDGRVVIDSSSYRLLSQDLNGVKTLLLRLKGVIQEAETISPFDQVNMKNFFYQSLVLNDTPSVISALSSEKNGKVSESLSLEDADLRRQLVLLQQELEDKNRTIHLLQQQMTKYANVPPGLFSDGDDDDPTHANAATQTERPRSLPSSFSSSSVDDGSMETLVSVQDSFEEQFGKQMKEQVNKVEEVSRSLNSLCQDTFPLPDCSRSLSLNRSHSSSELCQNKKS